MTFKFPHGLFVIRHCLTQNNIERRISGQSDSKIVDSHIDINKLDYETVNKAGLIIITSPATRCLSTALIIAQQYTGCISIKSDVRLLERSMGQWEGMRKSDVIAQNLGELHGAHMDPYFTPPDGECICSCFQRVDSFIKELVQTNYNAPVLICGHNQTLKILKYRLYSLTNLQAFWESENFVNGKIERLK